MPPPAEGFASHLFLGPALRTQSDRRLVALVRDGYETAFEEIVRRYGRALTRYAAAIVGSHSEDVTQDAFSKALRALRRSDAEIELRPWLFRIVRNTALNDLRDSPPTPEILAEAIAGGRNPAEELEQREELADLMRRLRALPEAQRAAIVMRELEGLSHDEIAHALGMSGGAARQAIYRARRALRDGVGMLVPLPLLHSMLAGAGPGVAETAAGAAGVGGAAGAGVALKATAATVLVAGAVGTGVALEDHSRSGDAKAAPTRELQGGATGAAPPLPVPAASSDDGGNEGPESDNSGPGGAGSGPDGDHSGPGRGRSDDGRDDDHGEDRDEDRGGRGGGGGGEIEDRSGPSGDDDGRSGSSGGGGSGSGHGGSGSSGSSGSGGDEPEEGAVEDDGDSSGSGSDDSDEDSSGSGSDDSDEDSSGSPD